MASWQRNEKIFKSVGNIKIDDKTTLFVRMLSLFKPDLSHSQDEAHNHEHDHNHKNKKIKPLK